MGSVNSGINCKQSPQKPLFHVYSQKKTKKLTKVKIKNTDIPKRIAKKDFEKTGNLYRDKETSKEMKQKIIKLNKMKLSDFPSVVIRDNGEIDGLIMGDIAATVFVLIPFSAVLGFAVGGPYGACVCAGAGAGSGLLLTKEAAELYSKEPKRCANEIKGLALYAEVIKKIDPETKFATREDFFNYIKYSESLLSIDKGDGVHYPKDPTIYYYGPPAR